MCAAACFVRSAFLASRANCQRLFESAETSGTKLLYLLCEDLIYRKCGSAVARYNLGHFYANVSLLNTKTSFKFFLSDLDGYFQTKLPLTTVFYELSDSLFQSMQTVLSNSEYLQIEMQSPTIPTDLDKKSTTSYHGVVLGGTFDKMHLGHEHLLTVSCFLANDKIVVGVTDDSYVEKKKILPELIDSQFDRVSSVRKFIDEIKPSLNEVIVEPMSDAFGPSIREKDLDAIVVSHETRTGASAVNQKRLELLMSPVEVEIIELTMENQEQIVKRGIDGEDKLSSSNQRKAMLGERLRPSRKPFRDFETFVIGVTGGIASGKSSLAQKIVNEMTSDKKKVFHIDCDKVGHSVYTYGSDCYERIVKEFGKEVEMVNRDGSKQINRQALAKIVFSDGSKLKQLNALLWPRIRKEALNLIEKKSKEGINVIVLEAALLIEAGWYDICHEVCVCIAPRDMILQRVKERNPTLAPEEIVCRIDSQITSKDRVAVANFVFSTQWNHEFTSKQVEKAIAAITGASIRKV